MPEFKDFLRRVEVCSVFIYGIFCVGVPPSVAADTAPAGVSYAMPDGLSNRTASAEWQMAKVQGTSLIQASCGVSKILQSGLSTTSGAMNNMTVKDGNVQMSAGALCQAATAVSIYSTCPGSDVLNVDLSSLSCSLVQMKGEAMIRQLQQQVDQSLCAVQCKKALTNAIKSEMQCLQAQSLMLDQQASSLTNQFKVFRQFFQKQMQTYKNTAADYEAKTQYLATKFAPIQQLQQEAVAMVSQQMPQDMQSITQMNTDIKNATTSIEQNIQTRKMALAMSCFDKPKAGLKCDPNSTQIVSPREYLVCRYEQNLRLGKGRVIEHSGLLAKRAMGSAADLSALLGRMTSDAPNMGETDAEGNVPSQSFLILSPAELNARYGQSLVQYTIGNTNAATYVTNEINSCYSRMAAQVEAERKQLNSSIGLQINGPNGVKAQQKNMTRVVGQMLGSYTALYSQIYGSLSGSNVSLNTSACTNASADTQVGCINDIQTRMQNVLKGTGGVSYQFKIPIQGTDPNTFENLSCSGLEGCMNTLYQRQVSLGTQKAQIEQTMKNYPIAANQQLDAYAQAFGQQLSVPNGQLTAMAQKLTTALGSLGVDGIDIGTIDAEIPERDENGIIQPRDTKAYLNQFVNPHLSNITAGSFSQASQGLGSVEDRLNEKLSRIQAVHNELNNLIPTCKATRAQSALQTLSDHMGSAENCYMNEICANQKMNQSLYDAAERIGNFPTGDMVSMSTLSTGISTICTSPVEGQKADQFKALPEEERRFQVAQYPARGCAAFKASLLSTDKVLGNLYGISRQPEVQKNGQYGRSIQSTGKSFTGGGRRRGSLVGQ